jgi:hypothetical protein
LRVNNRHPHSYSKDKHSENRKYYHNASKLVH